MAPKSATVRLAAPLPPRTRANPRALVFEVVAVLPSATSCMIVHKDFDVLAGNGGNPDLAEQRLYVMRHPPSIERDCVRLLLGSSPRH
jgi:hypothetical protein